MGTSKSYSASIKGNPQWGNLSGAVTSNCGAGDLNSSQLGNILSRYVGVIGGANVAGRGGSKIAGRAGIRTAKNLVHFLGAFSSRGYLAEALQEMGITGLDGKPISEVIEQLIERCSGPASTIDDVAAKAAAQKVIEAIAENVDSQAELEIKLRDVLSRDSLEEILIKYFSQYIFEHLSIMFYEKLVVEKGKSDCEDLFRQIKEFISERLKNVNRTNSLDNIDWNSDDADRLIKNIQEDVLKIFESYES